MIEPDIEVLKKIKIGQLEPAMQKELFELVSEIRGETTITASSSAHAFYKIYAAEQAKEKRNRKLLKKAEDMIMRLATLRHKRVEKEVEAKEEKSERTSGIMLRSGKWGSLAEETPISEKMRKLFGSIGIEDEKAMAKIVGFLGEEGLELRVGMISDSKLGDDLVKSIFSRKPEFLMKSDDDFMADLVVLVSKKSMVDHECIVLGVSEPPYVKSPLILFEEFHEIIRIVHLKPPEPSSVDDEVEEEKKKKLELAKIHPDDFIKVLVKKLGFTNEIRMKRENRVLSSPDGRVSVVQKPHGTGDPNFYSGLIRIKLKDAKIDEEEFVKAREEVGV